MTAETIFSTFVLLLGCSPILIIGIIQYRSKTPVGFWAGKEPPKPEQVTDIRQYNRKHGMMWIIYGVGLILCFFSGMYFGSFIAAMSVLIECIGGIFLMILYHNRLNRKYLKKEGDL